MIELPEAFKETNNRFGKDGFKPIYEQFQKPQELVAQINAKLIKDGKAVPRQQVPKVLRSEVRKDPAKKAALKKAHEAEAEKGKKDGKKDAPKKK